MSAIAIRILATGPFGLITKASLRRLADRGWGSRIAGTLREARELLGTFRFDLILAAETLPDGRGYDIAPLVARQLGSLMVGVALSESFLWLPVVDRGADVLGKRALNASMIEAEAEAILSLPRGEPIHEITSHPSPEPKQPKSRQTGAPDRTSAVDRVA
jgi:hypothetical protein